MEFPPADQVVKDVMEALGPDATDEEMDEHIRGLARLTDDELAEFGVASQETGADASEVPGEPIAGVAEPLEFAPVLLKARHDGWTAERQRAFIAALAETGCVSEACAEVGITPRSAYRLRERREARAFRLAWINAQIMAVTRLTSIAFERAIHGTTEQFYREGELVAERRKPSDRLLMFLLKHFDPVGFGWMEGKPLPPEFTDPRRDAIEDMPKLVGKLKDVDPGACPLDPLAMGDLIESPLARA